MPTATPPTEATNAELVRWAFDQLNAHTVENLRQFWDADTYERFPDRACRGTEEIVAYFEAAFAAMPDLRIEVVNVAEQNDDVYVQWRMTGHHSGAPWQGVAPTGKRIELDGIDHFVLREGRVISNFVVFDQMQFARAIGLLPADGTAADKAMKSAFNLLGGVRRRLR
jgi:predicted ester cyclase